MLTEYARNIMVRNTRKHKLISSYLIDFIEENMLARPVQLHQADITLINSFVGKRNYLLYLKLR